MRWTIKKDPEDGDYRTVTKFLFFPKCINDEVRWLEIATFTQRYCTDRFDVEGGPYWENICWGNEE